MSGVAGLEIVNDDGTRIPFAVVAEDKDTDIALLKAETTFSSVVSFGFKGQDPVMGEFLADIGDDGEVFSQAVSALNGFNSNAAANQAFLGVGGDDRPEGGITVTSVVEGGPAEEAGIAIDDVLLKLDGENIDNLMSLVTMINIRKPGEKVDIEGVRDAETTTWEVTLLARKDVVDNNGQPRKKKKKDAENGPKPHLGMSGTSEETGGMRVTKVELDGP
ncbi:MAG: PDZ domain-containing protein, partial [Planctomycetes bacterium]|nr:PDZ domain-containing protein [Planctomycetota bacterium]